MAGTSAKYTTNNAIFQANTVLFSKGSCLTLSANKVVIGSGVSKVRVSFSIFAESVLGAYIYPQIQKNGTSGFGESLKTPSSGYTSAGLSNVYINVTTGDTISIYVDTQAKSATIENSSSAAAYT
ncbi:MAG TPA: hypothetical protein VFL85_01495 [Candidatus Saccharimonadales bacterium]|nr:hypothetical protein [Candidatus Saccharimonadales bacterium]